MAEAATLSGREQGRKDPQANGNSSEFEEDNIRIDDYINDKLQTWADFAQLDSLIASVETQRVQLNHQVRINYYRFVSASSLWL